LQADVVPERPHIPPRSLALARRFGGVSDMEVLAVSISDAAKALGLGRTSIYAMIAEGRLEAFKLGRRRLVKVESIRRLVAAHKR
jgi:excisionase family DNA binding protein